MQGMEEGSVTGVWNRGPALRETAILRKVAALCRMLQERERHLCEWTREGGGG